MSIRNSVMKDDDLVCHDVKGDHAYFFTLSINLSDWPKFHTYEGVKYQFDGNEAFPKPVEDYASWYFGFARYKKV